MPSTLLFDGAGPRSPEPQPGQIYTIGAPNFPGFIFEWHPTTKRVYIARRNVTPVIGEMLADNVATHGDAINAVAVWLRGYRTAKLETKAPGAHVHGLDI